MSKGFSNARNAAANSTTQTTVSIVKYRTAAMRRIAAMVAVIGESFLWGNEGEIAREGRFLAGIAPTNFREEKRDLLFN